MTYTEILITESPAATGPGNVEYSVVTVIQYALNSCKEEGRLLAQLLLQLLSSQAQMLLRILIGEIP